MNYYYKLLKRGVIDENPTFVQLLALCPLLAVTTSAINGVYMGIATAAVSIGASTVISCLRKFIPNEIRVAAFIVIVAGAVTIVQLLMQAFAPPAINDSLGIFIPLIVVNCLVFARIESFASSNPPVPSAVDALGMGLGFTIGLTTLGVCRELLGSGSIFGIELLMDPTVHVLIMLMAPGAFFMMGTIIMIMKYFQMKKGGLDR